MRGLTKRDPVQTLTAVDEIPDGVGAGKPEAEPRTQASRATAHVTAVHAPVLQDGCAVSSGDTAVRIT